MSRTLYIRDSILARQLKTEARSKGIAARISGTLNRHWPELLAIVPENPADHWNPRRIEPFLFALKAALQSQLENELLNMAHWTADQAARGLRGAYRRHYGESFFREDDAAGSAQFTPYYHLRGPQLIQSPSAFEIARIVGPAPLKLTRLFNVDDVSGTIFRSISEGKTRLEISKTLRNMFQGDAVAARRVARTEGGRVATQVQLATSEQLKDEIAGYQVHAVPRTKYSREDHLHRSGTIYWRHPVQGQEGFDRMPQPPIDPGGIIEYNCRCWLSPVWINEPAPKEDAYGFSRQELEMWNAI